jgi:transposase
MEMAIKPFLPNKPRGVPRVNDRRVLNGIFWVLRSGAPWRDLPETFGPYTTCYNRFVRWGRAGVWDQIMDALAATCERAPRTNQNTTAGSNRGAAPEETIQTAAAAGKTIESAASSKSRSQQRLRFGELAAR